MGSGRPRPDPGRATTLSDATVTSRVRAAARTLRWYVRGVTGADAYERYCEHLTRTHPDELLPSERDFWREKYADQERNPKTRCC